MLHEQEIEDSALHVTIFLELRILLCVLTRSLTWEKRDMNKPAIA